MRFESEIAKVSLHFQPLEGNSTYCERVAAIEQVVVNEKFELNTRIVFSICSNVVTLVVKATETQSIPGCWRPHCRRAQWQAGRLCGDFILPALP